MMHRLDTLVRRRWPKQHTRCLAIWPSKHLEKYWYVEADPAHRDIRFAVPYLPWSTKVRTLHAWTVAPCGPVCYLDGGRLVPTPYWTNGAVMLLSRQYSTAEDVPITFSAKVDLQDIPRVKAKRLTLLGDRNVYPWPMVEVSNANRLVFVDARYLDVAYSLFASPEIALSKDQKYVIVRERSIPVMLIVGMLLRGERPILATKWLRGNCYGYKIRRG